MGCKRRWSSPLNASLALVMFSSLVVMSYSQYSTKVKTTGAVLRQQLDKVFQATGDNIDLVFVVDSSGSVTAPNFPSEIDFVVRFLDSFSVSYHQTRVALINFSDVVEVPFDHISSPSTTNDKCLMKKVQLKLDNIRYINSGTYTLGAMAKAREIFTSARPSATKMLFLLTDGESNGGDPVPEATLLKNMGVLLFTIGIANGKVSELRDMASSPYDQYTYIVDSFQEFKDIAHVALHKDLVSGIMLDVDVSKCAALCTGAGGDCCDQRASCSCGSYTGIYSCVCPTGSFGSGLAGTCTPCSEKTYHDGMKGPTDVSSCISCPDPQMTSLPGSSAKSDCSCCAGYRRVGDQCIVQHCPALPHPANGEVQRGCGTALGSTCSVSCHAGYRMAGSGDRTCQPNTAWSGTDTLCQSKPCPRIMIPNGGANCNSTNYGDWTLCTFQCNNRYRLVGTQSIMCMPPGNWNTTVPLCEKVFCTALAFQGVRINPVTCRLNLRPVGHTCAFFCDAVGYELRHRHLISTICNKYGKWKNIKNKIVQCVDVKPPEITCPSNINMNNAPGENFAYIPFTNVTTLKDNAAGNIRLQSEPVWDRHGENRSPKPMKIGNTTVTFIATDSSNNKNNCTFNVTVKDTEPPKLQSCKGLQIFVSTNNYAYVDWEEPTFDDNSRQPVTITKSRQPGLFQNDRYVVDFVGSDQSKNSATCSIHFYVQNHRCLLPENPKNGQVKCTEELQFVECIFTCNPGYAFGMRILPRFRCSYADGSWNDESVWKVNECTLRTKYYHSTRKNALTLSVNRKICGQPIIANKMVERMRRVMLARIRKTCPTCRITMGPLKCNRSSRQRRPSRRRNRSRRATDDLSIQTFQPGRLEENNENIVRDIYWYSERAVLKIVIIEFIF